MRTVQAAEAKAKFAALLDEVERGETIAITRHGKIATLAPQESEADRRQKAVQAILEYKKTGWKTGITIEDILSARDEGPKPL